MIITVHRQLSSRLQTYLYRKHAMIMIQPWEASMVKAIEKAIMTSDIGINPTNDGKCIRLVFPELTEERT